MDMLVVFVRAVNVLEVAIAIFVALGDGVVIDIVVIFDANLRFSVVNGIFIYRLMSWQFIGWRRSSRTSL